MSRPHTVVRRVRPVPIGPSGRAPAAPEVVDLRVVDGVVTELGPDLTASGADLVLDGEGRWVIPGLWDQHVHLTQWSSMLHRLDTAGTAGPEQVCALVAAHVAGLPAAASGLTIQGWGHRSALWARRPTVAELDAVSGDHPVVLIAGDGHHGWLNSAALNLLGLSGVTGPLAEDDWFPLFARLGELPGVAGSAEAAVVEAARRAAARGVVGVVDLEWHRPHEVWPARVAAGVDLLRVRAGVYTEGLDEVIARGLRTGDPLDPRGLVRMGPLKVISDGSLNTRTAYCCEPYADAAPQDPQPCGAANATVADLVPIFTRAREAGITVALHAIGDAAVRDGLAAIRRSGQRGSIEHAQLLRTAEIAEMARLGVVASVQPAHLLDDRDVTDRCWPDRTGRCFPFRDLLDAGVRLAFGSDAPVSPLDPWLAMAAAVHRSADERPAWHPEQALTVAEALAASTDGQGTVAVGGRGDLVLLDADPLAGDPSDTGALAASLRSMPVAATLLAGRPTHLAL